MTRRTGETVKKHERAYRRACIRLATKLMRQAGVPRSHFGFDQDAFWLCEMHVLTSGGTLRKKCWMPSMGVSSLRRMVEQGIEFWKRGQIRHVEGSTYTHVKH